jgi:hypothetical protein
MAEESSGDRRPVEPTFADVMNGFSFDSGRSGRRRRWGRRREGDEEQEPGSVPPPGEPRQDYPPESVQRPVAAAEPTSWPMSGPLPEPDEESEFDAPAGSEPNSASVRPYAWTRGRTRTGYDLQLETLVSTSPRGRDQLGLLTFEHRSVAELCEHVRSVAEVAALLAVPLGVAKVLVGDMAGMGLVVVHQSAGNNGDVPDLALMERVLSGLRRL